MFPVYMMKVILETIHMQLIIYLSVYLCNTVLSIILLQKLKPAYPSMVHPLLLVWFVLQLIFAVFCALYVYFCFICLGGVSCMPNIASLFALSIRDCT